MHQPLTYKVFFYNIKTGVAKEKVHLNGLKAIKDARHKRMNH